MASFFAGRAESMRISFCFLKYVRLLTVPLVLESTRLNKIYPGCIMLLLEIEVSQFVTVSRTPFCVCSGRTE